MFTFKPKKKVLIVISTLLTACIICAVFVSMHLNSGENTKIIKSETPVNEDKVLVGKISDSSTSAGIIQIDASQLSVKDDKKVVNTEAVIPTGKTKVVTPLTEIDLTKPSPPPRPTMIVKNDPAEKENINVKPKSSPPKPLAQANSKPSMGDVNGKGQVYVDGFGWIDDGGPNQVIYDKDMYENGHKVGIMD